MQYCSAVSFHLSGVCPLDLGLHQRLSMNAAMCFHQHLVHAHFSLKVALCLQW